MSPETVFFCVETKDHYKRLIYILALNNLKLSEDRLRSIIEDDKEKDHFKIIAMKAIESDLITDANHVSYSFNPKIITLHLFDVFFYKT